MDLTHNVSMITLGQGFHFLRCTVQLNVVSSRSTDTPCWIRALGKWQFRSPFSALKYMAKLRLTAFQSANRLSSVVFLYKWLGHNFCTGCPVSLSVLANDYL